jgi:hypothetical protein
MGVPLITVSAFNESWKIVMVYLSIVQSNDICFIMFVTPGEWLTSKEF